MSCFHPFKIFYTGHKTENGKKEGVIAFTDDDIEFYPLEQAEKRLGHKIEPVKGFIKIDPNTTRRYLIKYDEIPCGICLGCRLDKAGDWANRLLMEIKTQPVNNWFLTVTYDEEHYPISLSKRDIQLFLKRMRKKQSFRYFIAGEYGTKTFRPHYHMILLSYEIGETKQWDKQQLEMLDLEKTWGKGRILGTEANAATIAYTTAYTTKKAYNIEKEWPNMLEKPFILMSRKPGLGYKYLETRLDTISEEGKIYVNGARKLPRYAKKLIEKQNPELLERINEASRKTADQMELNDISQFNTDFKTDINQRKEDITKSKISSQRREKI